MTYGGRKNCSIRMYMPRNISVSRKYLPARSSTESFSSSHLGGRARRNPLGGGPEGVAYVRRARIRATVAAGIGCRLSSCRESVVVVVAVAVKVVSPCIVHRFPRVEVV